MDKFAKPWRNRSKIVSNTGTALWTPKGDFRWCSAGGTTVVLTETKLSMLSNPELRTLQRLALFKLQTLSINCTIPSYKGDRKYLGRKLKKSLHRRKRSGEGSFSILDKISGGSRPTGVFATPLKTVLRNDRLAAAGIKPVTRQTRRKSEPTALSPEAREKVPRRRRASANTPPNLSALKRQNLRQEIVNFTTRSTSSTSLRSADSSQDGDCLPQKRHSDSDSVLISDLVPGRGVRAGHASKLLDALTLDSTSASASCLMQKPKLPIPSPPQVPSIVQQSIKYLEIHGLHILGIFRVAGSKKRLKQLRDEFDSGVKVSFDEEDNAHDVAALFKEFLRCLPEPLLTRELYMAFLTTQRFKDMETQLNALRYLWYLLPECNRDTLQCLLSFLKKVGKYAEDTVDENNQMIPGNKMTCRNLATLMGPNILHKVKKRPHQQNYVVENYHRAEENTDVIDVTEDLINYHEQLSTVSPEMHDQVMRFLVQTEPETVDFILKRKANAHKGEDIQNILKGSGDIISQIDDKETTTRLTNRANNVDGRTQSAPGHGTQYSSAQALHSEHNNDEQRLHNRCGSVDAQFVRNYGLNPNNGISEQSGQRRVQKQRSYAKRCSNSEPTTSLKSSISFSYFSPSPSPNDMQEFRSSTGTSPSSSLSSNYSSNYRAFQQYTAAEGVNGHMRDDTSSISESTVDSYVTTEDFDDMDMRRQWLEWEALSKNFDYDDDFLDQETLV